MSKAFIVYADDTTLSSILSSKCLQIKHRSIKYWKLNEQYIV